ncbi:glycosyltransferase family 2 protein [Paenibacillus sp. FJAT-26967]|uniref:glycosyltransferase family 2 protein n=1 Tax=Paenibacillus sp. FJAT-26967 TaxID=1729690 RepID=UPI000839570D|nr:glycosyltransferase family 2 protein [Paenibacillus sp. FJAT-26967]
MNRTSIIILTHNQIYLTYLCLESIRRHTPEPYEIIVVDNGSTDRTVKYLLGQPDVLLIQNETNLGFAKGCNQGYAAATGDTILFLNNDTIVTPGWLTRMLSALYSDTIIGMVGPVSNYVSGRQQIPVHYQDFSEAEAFSIQHAAQHKGQRSDERRIVGFCMLVKREVLEEVGCFDEQYGLGNYEDDDLCLRVLNSGYRIQIVYDSFIHHFGHMTMGILNESSLHELLVLNREKARQKWGADIHSLIYKEPATMSVIVPIGPATSCRQLKQMMESVRHLADEWILLGNQPSDEVKDYVSGLTCRVITSELGDSGVPDWSYMRSAATKQYLLWMNPEEWFAGAQARRLAGVKLQLDGDANGISILYNMKLSSADSGLVTLRRIRMVRREAEFSWNAAIHEFIPNPAAIRNTDICLTLQ